MRKIIKLMTIAFALYASVGARAINTDTDGYYLIGSVQDWKDFAALISSNPTANARMTDDIDLGDDQTMIGATGAYVESPAFKGIFDGQGHTLKVAYTGIGADYVGAPFAKINGATIKNLHVTGTINSGGYHPTSVVSDSWGSSLLEQVWGDVDITSTGSGWIEASGLVGCMKSGSLTIRDCLFTGTVNGTGGYNGCFIGYIDSGSASVSNCLSTGSFSYSGGSNGFRGSHTNCYVKQFPTSYPGGCTQTTDITLADGTIATALQAGRGEVIWVQDPVLNQPMLKQFVSLNQDGEGYYLISSVQDWKNFSTLVLSTPSVNARMTADINLGDDQTMISSPTTNTYRYKGTFDGQGHTLTVAYNSGDWEAGHDAFATPFPNIEGATIRNLHVDGSQSSYDTHTSGIAANVWGSGNVLENIWISTAINGESKNQSAGEYAAFVGCMKSGSSITISDCLFTGSINGKGDYNGGFVGYFDGSNSAIISNCLSTGSFSYTGSGHIFARGSATNCFYTSFVNTPDNAVLASSSEIADGTIATALQAGRGDEIWVQDPVMNIPMLKIFASPVVPVIITATSATVWGQSKYVATFYNSAKTYELPAGALAYTAELDGTSMVLYRIGENSNVIPAGSAVVILSDISSIELTGLASTSVEAKVGNILLGSDTAVAVTAGKVDDKTPYVIGIKDGVLGLYKYDGESIPARKAYYLKVE